VTKAGKLTMIAAAQCPKGGVHHWDCTWPEPQTYIETCLKCGEVRKLDERLGMSGPQTTRLSGSHARGPEYRLRSTKGRFADE